MVDLLLVKGHHYIFLLPYVIPSRPQSFRPFVLTFHEPSTQDPRNGGHVSGEDHWRAVIHFVLLSFLRSPFSSALVPIKLASVVDFPKKWKQCDMLTFLGNVRVCFFRFRCLSHSGWFTEYYMCKISPALSKLQWTNTALSWIVFLSPPELTFAWIFNEYPHFVQQDSRRFISQETGSLYIAKVEPSDVGNYTCVVNNTVTREKVLSSPTPLVLRSDGKCCLLSNFQMVYTTVHWNYIFVVINVELHFYIFISFHTNSC